MSHVHGHPNLVGRGRDRLILDCTDALCDAWRRGYETGMRNRNIRAVDPMLDEIRGIRALNRWLTDERNRMRRELVELRARGASSTAGEKVAQWRRRHPLSRAG